MFDNTVVKIVLEAQVVTQLMDTGVGVVENFSSLAIYAEMRLRAFVQ